MRKWWYRRILIMFLVLTTVLGAGFGMEQLQAEAEQQQVSGRTLDHTVVYPGGMAIGIYMETDGVLVLSTESIEGMDGEKYEPAKNLIKSGDYIVGMNDKTIANKKELIHAVGKLKSKDVILTVRRNEETIDVKLKAVEVEKGDYKLGIWVKDNIQGLGTVTYITGDSEFGALGHGIHDAETDELLEISNGISYKTKLTGVTKGVKGEPGGLEGIIIYNSYNELGSIDRNTDNGIFGTMKEANLFIANAKPMEICKKRDIKLGKATIRCTINNTVKEYDIKIKNVDNYTANVNKGIYIEVVDKELLALTGGIVQGMSGSPILQNGKIVGAVTHVLVNDPTRGYGIFIEDMLKQ